MRTFETLGQYHDFWASLVLHAPNRFFDVRRNSYAKDQSRALQEAFGELREGIHFVQQKLKDDRLTRIIQEMFEMSLEAYSVGDKARGAHILQECEGMVWPKFSLKTKYGVEAELRAFGTNVTFAGVLVSPFPSEGTQGDMGDDQAMLLDLAQRFSRSYQSQQRDFRYFSWVIDQDGIIRRTSSEPKEDEHPVLPPVQKSFGNKRLKELGHSGQIRACVLMQISTPQSNGLVIYDLEERGHPRVSARQLFKIQADGSYCYEKMRFFLEDAYFFKEQLGIAV